MKRSIYYAVFDPQKKIMGDIFEAKFDFDFMVSKLFDTNQLLLAMPMSKWLASKNVNSRLLKKVDNGEVLEVGSWDGCGYCFIANAKRKVKYLVSQYGTEKKMNELLKE